uniref:Endonuclease/exonuclease/phosphatase domain-containing protein n=1 Tax=Micrurus paraensis TaxID=1970185 RepID=A0A2D4KHC4_9SAUR
MEERKKLISINGLNSAIKRKKIFHKLGKLNMDIISLQEVHIKRQHEHLLNCPRLGNIFTSLAQQNERGVVLCIRNTIKTKQIYTDEEGRILMVEIIANNSKYF